MYDPAVLLLCRYAITIRVIYLFMGFFIVHKLQATNFKEQNNPLLYPAIYSASPTWAMGSKHTYVENFYLLKIHLNLFEIPNQVLKFEKLISIWNFFILSENLFQTWTLRSGAICVYSSLSCVEVEYMHIAPLRGGLR